MSDSDSLGNFTGVVRLFPLPDVVLFPHMLLPLRIFEPRYTQMIDDALQSDRLISMALLRPGWEPHYHERPPVYDIACVGQITSDEALPDGRYNLLLRGLKRARIEEELKTDKLYRSARVRLVDDLYPQVADDDREKRRELLKQLFRDLFPTAGQASPEFDRMLDSEIPLGTLVDILAFTIGLDVALKQDLLEEPNVDRRCDRLVRYLQQAVSAKSTDSVLRSKFPPEFSVN